jgi:hypothetical protein
VDAVSAGGQFVSSSLKGYDLTTTQQRNRVFCRRNSLRQRRGLEGEHQGSESGGKVNEKEAADSMLTHTPRRNNR